MSIPSILKRLAYAVAIGAVFASVFPVTSEAQTCRTTCRNSNATCHAGSCRCSPGGNGICAPPYPAAVPPDKTIKGCSGPGVHIQNCGGYKLCCGTRFGICVDGDHPMCEK
jgi:hypothetical protein